MAAISEPGAPSRPRAPRVIAPQYVFVYDPESYDTDEVLQALCNGLDPKLVDPKFYPALSFPIRAKHDQLRRDGNISASRALRDAISQFDRWQSRERQKRELGRLRVQQREEYAHRLHEEEEELVRAREATAGLLQESVHLAVNGRFREIEPQIYKRLGQELRRLQTARLEKGDYRKAARYEFAARRVAVLSSDNRYEEIAIRISTDRHNKVAAARRELQNKRAQWRTQISERQSERDRSIESLRAQFERELAEFDTQFSKQFPASYRKYSPTYLNLREQERHLQLTKRFMEAKAKSEEAARQGEQEEIEFQAKYIADLEMKRAEMMRRMTWGLSVEESKADEELFLLERESKRNLEQANLALRRLEKRGKEADVLASLIPGSARTSPRASARSIKSARSCRVRKIGPPEEERSPQEVFRQRRAINSIVYSTSRT
jgi:hypothetical protein